MTYSNFRQIIDLWQSRIEMAAFLDVKPCNISMMYKRDSVNGQYFDKIVAGAQAMGHADVTHELLCKLAARNDAPAQDAGVS